jgi:hypothetical protein
MRSPARGGPVLRIATVFQEAAGFLEDGEKEQSIYSKNAL